MQSFHNDELEAAGRMHRRDDIARAAQFLRAAGIENISMDLIAGLPLQSAKSWQQSLDELLALRPEHISIYLLEIDEGSRLGRESLAGGSRYHAAAIPSEDDMANSTNRLRNAGVRRIRALRNLQLGVSGPPFAPQFKILAPRALSRLWSRRAFF